MDKSIVNPVLDANQSSTAYYAPCFKVFVNDEELDSKTNGDVLSLKVDMDAEQLDRFELTVSNWDDRTLDFKYSDTSKFDVNNRVTVMLGYADKLVTVMQGVIETLTPNFPESGTSTLAIAGMDGLSRLRNRQPVQGEQRKFVKLHEYEIVQIIARRNNLTPVCDQDSSVNDVVWQYDLDDATFLMERARRIDFDLYVQTDPTSKQELLYFVSPKDDKSRDAVRLFADNRNNDSAHSYVFEWGKSLMSFSPKLNSARQVSKVIVRGWDPVAKQKIEATAQTSSLPKSSTGGTCGPDVAGNKQEVVVDMLVTSQAEAQRIANSILAEKAYNFITGDGRVIGLPDLRPGRVVELQGLGTRFSGDYHLRHVTHSLGSDGFTTTFSARRLYAGSLRK